MVGGHHKHLEDKIGLAALVNKRTYVLKFKLRAMLAPDFLKKDDHIFALQSSQSKAMPPSC
eukprot:4781159-Karenia_brevis.AAC.1